MIVSWMLGATAFTTLLGVAALAAERALRATNRATRAPWVCAVAAAVVWPVVAPMWQRFMLQVAAPAVVIKDAPISASAMITQQLPPMPTSWSDVAGTAVLAFWAIVSVLLIARLIVAAVALSRLQRDAHHAVVDGESVLVTESLGPAAVGLLQPRVAVPEWFLQLDAPLRALVLRHEREHCRSRDPQLVWLAALSVALMPWNVALWWLSRRLRLALEIDCDSRTLRAERSTERYGKLLLLIAQRQSGYPLSTMLAESTSHLSRRITAMQMPPLRRPVVRVVALSVVSIAAVAVACSPRIASDLTAPKTTVAPSKSLSTTPGASYFEFQVDKPVTALAGSVGPKYPDSLRTLHIAGQVLAQFVVNEQGLAETNTLKILKSDDSAFTNAVRTALPMMRFNAAQLKGKSVKQLVQQPFMFSADKSGVGAASRAAVVPKHANLPHIEGEPYYEYQVQQPVISAPGSVGPKYPQALKDAHVEGRVLAQFVVNEEGVAEVNTFKVLAADAPEFQDAVAQALPKMRFVAARKDGKVVRQVVQQPFQFSLSR